MASPSSIAALEVILTASCNLRCGYCYQNDKKARHMQWPTLQAALDLILRSDVRDCTVLFIGGEPLLQRPLLERAVAYVEAEAPHDKRVAWSLATNGTLLDDDALDFLVRHRIQTQVSFDGVPAAQAFRGAGTFAKLDALLERVRAQTPPSFRRGFRVGMTLHSGNVAHLADSVAYFLGKGIASIAMSPLSTPDPGWTPAHFVILQEQFERILSLSRAWHARTGVIPVEIFRPTPSGPRTPEQRRDLMMCNVASGQAVAVDVDGQVSGCVTFAESYQRFDNAMLRDGLASMRLGDVRAPELAARMAAYPAAARATGLFHRKADKHSSYARCGECRFIADCAVCPTSIGLDPANTDPRRVPDLQCAFHLVALAASERHARTHPLAQTADASVPP